MTLGQLFKNKRSELGRSLEQISASTKIHTKILTALEGDQYVELPARTFTRGFIVTYCRALKLDSEQVLREYHDFLESKFNERRDRDQGHQGYVFEGKELEQNKRWMVIGATLAALFAIAVLLIFKPQNHHRKEKHKEFAEEEMAATEGAPEADVPAPTLTTAVTIASTAASPSATPAVTATATPSVSPSASPSATPKLDKLNKGDDLQPKEVKRRILFEAVEDTWVRYRTDDKPPMTIILRKGRQLVVKAKNQIQVETNQAASLRYKTRTSQYVNLDQTLFSVEGDGALKSLPAGAIAPGALPATVPSPASP